MTYETYYCESETLASLRAVNTRLYDDRPLAGDDRRDLANRMEALLGNIEQLPVIETPGEAHDPTTLYAQIAHIAGPIVKHYKDDIAIHDKAALAALQPGDAVLWGCRESGSHITRLDFADRELGTTKRRVATLANRDMFRSVLKHWPETLWYLLTVLDHDGHGTVKGVSVKKAEQLYAERLD